MLSTAETATPGAQQDSIQFKNFQTIIGSTHGDTYLINNTTDLESLYLGFGSNKVFADNVTDLVLEATINNSLDPNDITLVSSKVHLVGLEGSNNIVSLSDSTLSGQLQGQDLVTTDGNVNNKIDIWVGNGYHSISSDAGSVNVNVYPVRLYQDISNGLTPQDPTKSELAKAKSETHITVKNANVDVFISLGSSAVKENVRYVGGQLEFSTSTRDEVVTLAVTEDNDNDGIFFENDGFVRSSDGVTIGIQRLLDAMNFIEGRPNSGYLSGNIYSFDTLKNATLVAVSNT